MSTESNPPEEKVKPSSLFPDNMFKEESYPTVFMPEFVTSFFQGWINSSLGYIVIIVMTALIFGIGGVIEMEYIMTANVELLPYYLILAGIFGIGFYCLMYGVSISVAPVATQTVLAIIIINALFMAIISQIDQVAPAHSLVTFVFTGNAVQGLAMPEHITTNIWIVRLVQAGFIALIVSQLNGLLYTVNETRLNIGLTTIVFIGLIGLSLGYVELLENIPASRVRSTSDLRIEIIKVGAIYGGALASLFLLTYKMAHKAKSPLFEGDKPKNFE